VIKLRVNIKNYFIIPMTLGYLRTIRIDDFFLLVLDLNFIILLGMTEVYVLPALNGKDSVQVLGVCGYLFESLLYFFAKVN